MNRHARAGDSRRPFAATIALVCGIASLVASAAPAHASDEVAIERTGLPPREVAGGRESGRHVRVCDDTTLSIQDRPEVCIER